jgi:hypothetical protein
MAGLPEHEDAMSPQNVRSNIEDWFWTRAQRERYEEEVRGTHLGGPDTSSLHYRQRLRALYIQKIPGYAEKLIEEYEAQLYYNEHKNKKKSDPAKFYDARDRLFDARHAVNAMTHRCYTGINQIDAMADSIIKDNDWIASEFYLEARKEWEAQRPPSHEEVATAQSLARESFPDWLTQEIRLYEAFLAEPWRQQYFGAPFLQLSKEVASERLRYLKGLQNTADTDGMDAAYTRHVDEDGYLQLRTQWDSEFTKLDHETVSGKDGYWSHMPHSPRPQLLDPVTDAELIAKNKARYAAQPPRPKVGLAEWLESGQRTEHQPPKRPPGRPKGAKNKPKPRPVNPDVAAWQAEADEKYPHLKAS